MSLRLVALLVTIFSSIGACSEGVSHPRSAPEHDFPTRLAWAGVGADGLIVVAEPIGNVVHTDNAILDEESMLRDNLDIRDSQQLLRLHLGPSAKSGLPDSSGTLLADGIEYIGMAEMPEAFTAQQRLIWHSVAQGGRHMVEDSQQLQRWSFLVLAKDSVDLDQIDKMLWRNGSMQVELQRQSWSEVERLQFLEASVPVDVEDE